MSCPALDTDWNPSSCPTELMPPLSCTERIVSGNCSKSNRLTLCPEAAQSKATAQPPFPEPKTAIFIDSPLAHARGLSLDVLLSLRSLWAIISHGSKSCQGRLKLNGEPLHQRRNIPYLSNIKGLRTAPLSTRPAPPHRIVILYYFSLLSTLFHLLFWGL